MMILLLTLVAALAAWLGGYVAVRSRNHLHAAMAFTAGLVLGLVAFDLLPEVFEGIEHAHLDPAAPMAMFAGGFLLFHIVEKLILMHAHKHGESDEEPQTDPKIGFARAAALAGHSLLDGLSIGLAFQVNTAVGVGVAFAVIGHRFADGFDTANFMLLQKNSVTHIRQFMAVVIALPILGGLLSLFFELPETALVLYLAMFAGILMYMAASNILVQTRPRDTYTTIFFAVLGALSMFTLTRLLQV